MSLLRSEDNLSQFWSALRTLERYGALPQAGGWGDQPATFVEAHDLVAPFLAHLRTPPKPVEIDINGR